MQKLIFYAYFTFRTAEVSQTVILLWINPGALWLLRGMVVCPFCVVIAGHNHLRVLKSADLMFSFLKGKMSVPEKLESHRSFTGEKYPHRTSLSSKLEKTVYCPARYKIASVIMTETLWKWPTKLFSILSARIRGNKEMQIS